MADETGMAALPGTGAPELVPPLLAEAPPEIEDLSKKKGPAVDAADEAGGSETFDVDTELQDRFGNLNLCGEEETDLDFSAEIDDLMEEVRWIALFRVHTSKAFSHAAMFKQMRNAWSTAQDVTFKTKGENLFLAQFHCLGDWNRVMDGGPWLFRNAALVMVEYDGFTNVDDYKLDKIPVWTRIQGIPEGLMKKKELAEKVARKVGDPPITVIVNEGIINSSKYLRARVHVVLSRPLVRLVPITLKERKVYPVQYEKLPDFCNFCGMIGHIVTECGDGVHPKDQCQWGEWLKVAFEPSFPSGGGRGGGNRGGFGNRGRGRGVVPGTPNFSETTDMDWGTAATNPRGQGMRKRPMVYAGMMNNRVEPSTNSAAPGRVAHQVNLLEYGKDNAGGGNQVDVPSTQKVQPPKRTKRVVDGVEIDENMGSATSGLEDRREQ
ncbi:hypothetical protein ACQ4PT_012401 [Festuca glaucescens]